MPKVYYDAIVASAVAICNVQFIFGTVIAGLRQGSIVPRHHLKGATNPINPSAQQGLLAVASRSLKDISDVNWCAAALDIIKDAMSAAEADATAAAACSHEPSQ